MTKETFCLTEAGRFARCPVLPELFCPDPESIHPESEVVSPGIWSRFARELRISLSIGNISENHKNQVKFKICFWSMDGWMIELQQSSLSNKARWSTICRYLWVSLLHPRAKLIEMATNHRSLIDPSTSTTHRESDYSLLRKLPYWNIGHNLYQTNWLSVRAKRLQTRGESILGPGETTSGEQDIGRNDRNSCLTFQPLCSGFNKICNRRASGLASRQKVWNKKMMHTITSKILISLT